MNRSIYSSVLLFSFSILVAVSYQNCGDVGGTSPFSFEDPDPVDGNGAQQTGNFLSLQFTNNPIVQNNVLTANFACNYTPFSYNSHIVSITVASSSGSYSQSWTTYCSGSNFSISKTLNSGYISANTHTVTATLTGIANNLEPIPGGAGATAIASIGQGSIFPTSTQVFTQDFNSLAEGGSQFRDVVALNAVPQNYHAYTALRGKLEFTVSTALPQNNGIYYGLLELLPYETSGSGFSSEYAMSASRYITNQSTTPFDQHELIQSGFQGNTAQAPAQQRVPAFTADTKRAFIAGQTYAVDFVVRKGGTFSMRFYNKSNSSETLYFANGASLEGFNSNLFGTTPMLIRLGQTSVSTGYHSGFSNVKLLYKVCGYVNTTYDTTCSESAL